MPLLIAHAAVTWLLVGLIWTIQVVHYPLFAMVGEEGYAAYQASHVQRISLIVMLPMLAELASALYLAVNPPAGISSASAWLGFALVGVIWAVTGLWSVPAHDALATGFDPEAHRSLVLSNWGRTLAWSARGLLVAGWLLTLTREST